MRLAEIASYPGNPPANASISVLPVCCRPRFGLPLLPRLCWSCLWVRVCNKVLIFKGNCNIQPCNCCHSSNSSAFLEDQHSLKTILMSKVKCWIVAMWGRLCANVEQGGWEFEIASPVIPVDGPTLMSEKSAWENTRHIWIGSPGQALTS